MITVTKTYLPALVEYQKYLAQIWDKQWLTNRGPLLIELEEKLKEKLITPHILVVNNGTIPLQIALKLLGKKGEIITTPFSYVATTSSIVWEGCTPVFVDIHPEYFTIDESKIEVAITNKTTAILATHVFGNPCNIDEIQRIATKYNLKVIYDAAHSFGVNYKKQSLFNFGDVSTCSFHATKIFHTGEGGAFFTKDKELQHQLFYSHNFGHNGPLDFYGVGINAKISELQAAMGLAVLPHFDFIVSERKKVVNYYLKELNFKKLKTITIREETQWNYCYFPIVFESETQLLKTQASLNELQIYPRRYFYPSLNLLDYVKPSQCPNSESLSKRVLCLPLYVGLTKTELKIIVETINISLI